jgi:uncharacterized metal-binding protein
VTLSRFKYKLTAVYILYAVCILVQMSVTILYVQVTVHRDKFRKNNQLDALISKIYFCHKSLHVSDIFCAYHQGLSTVHTAVGTLRAEYVTASKQSQVGTAY